MEYMSDLEYNLSMYILYRCISIGVLGDLTVAKANFF